MSFKDIKAKNQGFTIVELLIVVVVIAILAAITIVSYNGITNQANASAAKSTAAALQKKIELYYADSSTYPDAMTDLTSASSSDPWYIASGSIGITATEPTSSNGKNTLQVVNCSTTGVEITYYDYEAGTATGKVKIGTGTCPTTGYWT